MWLGGHTEPDSPRAPAGVGRSCLVGPGSPLAQKYNHSHSSTYRDLGGVLLPDEPDIFHSLFCKKERGLKRWLRG